MSTSAPRIDAARLARPATAGHLWRWIAAHTGLRVPHRPVCRGHCAPFAPLADAWADPPPVALVLGPRGGGKSLTQGLLAHLHARFDPGRHTRILGGSRAQAAQVYEAIKFIALDAAGPAGADRDALAPRLGLLKTEATYRTGTTVSILSASPTSVRGPHVPRLALDEVDEIDAEVRDAAFGMCMGLNGWPASVLMTSTWHRPGGPMSALLDRARGGDFPLYSYCIFDVLQRCPEERSGPGLERCPECPLMPWCHEDRDEFGGVPRAKRSAGHYPIDSLVQKARTVSARVFEADYLCSGPKADGLWFASFSEASHVGEDAEYDPALPAYWAIDCGVETGAILAQLRPLADGTHLLTVFADYYSYDVGAEAAARDVLELGRARCNGRRDAAYVDPAGRSRTAIGVNVFAEYERAGLRPLTPWPNRPGAVADGLALVEAFVRPADGRPRLRVHPRCRRLIDAFRSYRRDSVRGQWLDKPADPQHPAEDLIDPVRGLLMSRFPGGRRPPSGLPRVPASRVF